MNCTVKYGEIKMKKKIKRNVSNREGKIRRYNPFSIGI